MYNKLKNDTADWTAHGHDVTILGDDWTTHQHDVTTLDADWMMNNIK